MRIAYLITDPGIPVRGGKGAAVHVRAMTSSLADLGHEVRVLAADTGGEEPWDARAELYSLVDSERLRTKWRGLRRILNSPDALSPTKGGGDALSPGFAENRLREMHKLEMAGRSAEEAIRLLKANPADIILERLSPFGAAGPILSRRMNTPRIVEMNAPLTEESRRWRNLEFVDISLAAERSALRGAAGVAAVSGPLVRRCRDLGLPADRILLLPNGVDPDFFRPGRRNPELASILGLTDARVVGFAGSLKPWHGVDRLMEAFARLSDRGGRRRLLVVGDGPERARLMETADRMRIADRTVFTGAVPHARMPDHIRLMDVAAAPYRSEGGGYFSPLKILEFMACGIPVAASGGGDIPRLVKPERGGLTVPEDDADALSRALDGLLADPDRRARLGAAARSAAEERTWAANARRLTEFMSGIREAGG